MTIAIIEVTAEGADTSDYSLGTGSDKVSAVQLPDDDDTSRIQVAGTGVQTKVQSYALQVLKAAEVASVTAKVRERVNGGTIQRNFYWRTAGGVNHNTTNGINSQTYSTASQAFLPQEGAWTPPLLLNLELGVRCTQFSAFIAHFVTTMSAEVDFTPLDDGFVYLVGCWAAALSGIAGAALELGELQAFLRSQFRTFPNRRRELMAVRAAIINQPRYAV